MMIAVPTLENRPIHIDWAFSFKNLTPPINFNVVYACVKNKPVDQARNEIVAEAIKQGHRYLLFVGDDTVMPAHALRMFLFRMENTPNCAAVGGVYFSKSLPPAPLIFRGNGSGSYWDWKVGEYFEVTGMGMDCILLDVEWLKKVPAPWWFLPCTSLAIAPPTVTKRVPGVTDKNQPRGTNVRKISSSDTPPSQDNTPVSASNAAK
jgi:hypothetical protein